MLFWVYVARGLDLFGGRRSLRDAIDVNVMLMKVENGKINEQAKKRKTSKQTNKKTHTSHTHRSQQF